MINRRVWSQLDGRLIVLALALMTVGIINLYSASINVSGGGLPLYQRQLCWLGIGVLLALLVFLFDYHTYREFAYSLYFLAFLAIACVFVYGMVVGGAQRWIKIGIFNLQPSVVPTLLIAKQPDLGTAFVLVFIFLSIVMFVKIRFRSLLILLIVVILATPFFWAGLKGYQRSRILTFLNPNMDPLGAGYHIIQSKIAMGSGGIWGKGYLHGTQCKLQFLPAHHTDFIFAVLGEEWGFVGCGIVLALYMALILWGLNISVKAKDRLIVNLMGIGVLLNIRARRHIF